MSSKPWQSFRVGAPSSNPGWTNPNCQELRTVAHVTHLPNARRIAEDGRIRADLVFDRSKLNTERIRVVWLSPNDWTNAGGFRYGNVRFQYDWNSLIQEKRYYWVESISYGISACRILVTDKDYSTSLEPYDPQVGDGPWWLSSSGQHYWNGNHCLEFMIEGDISLTDSYNIDFVKHHVSYCNIDPRTCTYRDRGDREAGQDFLALLGSEKKTWSLTSALETKDGATVPNRAFNTAFTDLMFKIRTSINVLSWGALTASDALARLIARAVLHSLSPPSDWKDATILAAQFQNRDELELAIADLLDTALGVPPSSGFRHQLSCG
ncbi:MAG: hypothetical protein JNM40_10480 [Myxococcales bacterium]|nr:hypothetical protein [Myxococcales bacterium]